MFFLIKKFFNQIDFLSESQKLKVLSQDLYK